jgi:hypothetical protein
MSGPSRAFDSIARFLNRSTEEPETNSEDDKIHERMTQPRPLDTRSYWGSEVALQFTGVDRSCGTVFGHDQKPCRLGLRSEHDMIYEMAPENDAFPANRDADSDTQNLSAQWSFFDLPRELRDIIYSGVYRNQSRAEQCIIIEARRLYPLREDSSLLALARYLGSPITQTNKQVAVEYAERILKTQRIYIRSGPTILHTFFRYLDKTHLQWIKAIEMDWLTMPMELYYKFEQTEEREIWPLFLFIKMHTNIQSITVPLYFLEVGGARGSGTRRNRSEKTIFLQHRREVLNYWAVIGAHALSLLLHDALDEVCIRIRPYDTWSLLEPAVKVRVLANTPWKSWKLDEIEPLQNLQHQVNDRSTCAVDVRELIVAVKVQPWLEENIGEELLITMRKPPSIQIHLHDVES